MHNLVTCTPVLHAVWCEEQHRILQFGIDRLMPYPDVHACRQVLPIPYMLPPAQYTSSDQPWCVDMEYAGLDSLGHTINDPPQSFYGQVQPPD